MSNFRVCKIKKRMNEIIGFEKFDDKQDAEHYAKNQSLSDNHHNFEIQKNVNGEFTTIKVYQDGQEI